MATFTIEIRSTGNATGPSFVVTGSASGHTVVVNDYMHPDGPQGAPITDAHGRRGKQISVNT